MTATDWTTDTQGVGQYAEINGINLYFETHGGGHPLILLHGGLGSGEGRPKGGHALAILPGLTHYNTCASPLFAAVTLAFLDGQGA